MEALKQRYRKWVLTRPWVRQEMYSRIFKAAQKDLEETQQYDMNSKAEELAIIKLNALLAPVDLHKIVTLDKIHGIVYIGGVRADQGRLANLQAEAKYLLESDLWALLYHTPNELAHRAMFVNSESLDDLKKGKSILYTTSTQKNILETLLSYAQPKGAKEKRSVTLRQK